MMVVERRARTVSHVEMTLAGHRLGIPSVMAFVLAAAAPLTVVAGSASTGFAVTGFVGVPIAYLACGAILSIFSVGYVAMARRIPQSGGFYAYIARGLGRTPGVGAAMIALLAYTCMQVSLYGAAGVVAAEIGTQLAGVTVAWWIYALAAWAIVAVLGMRSVRVNGRVVGALLLAEIVVVLVFDVVMIGNPAGGAVSFTALSPAQLTDPQAGAILVGGIAGFVGYEATVVFAEEVKDPRRTVARATYLALALIALLYGLSAWAMTVAAGPAGIVAAAQREGTELFFALAAPHLPAALVDGAHLLLLTSLFAALLAFHNMIARYGFSLGREGVIPSVFALTSSRSAAPVVGSGVQSAIALAVLLVFAAFGLDPIRHLFFFLGVTGGLGVLILMAGTSVAVVRWFARRPDGESRWRRTVAPAISAVLLGAVLVLTVSSFHLMLDVPASSPLRWVLPGLYLAAGVLGVVWALVLRARRPEVFQAVGLGPESVTV